MSGSGIGTIATAGGVRAGMAYIIDELRGMCEAGTADYTVAGSAYWTDDQLQTILDDNVINFKFEECDQVPDYSDVDYAVHYIVYMQYRAPFPFLEADPTVSALKDITGGTVTSAFAINYRTGQIDFTNDQRGTVYFMSGRSYDINAAAVQVWEQKAAHYAGFYNFSTDTHNLQREVLMKHCLTMADRFRVVEGTKSLGIERDDCP